MATWASKLATSAPPVPSPPAALSTQIEGDSSYAVLDASALIGVSGLHRIADKCVITPEVYNEVTDKSSRQALENLPFGIEQLEPAAESVAAGMSEIRSQHCLVYLAHLLDPMKSEA